MGRGSGIQTSKTVGSKDLKRLPKVALDGDKLTLNIESVTIEDQVVAQNSGIAEIHISEGVTGHEDITKSIEDILNAAPEPLKRKLKSIYVLNHFAPVDNGAMNNEEDNILIWRVEKK